MAVGLSTRNLFVLTLIGSFAYTVYPLPVGSSVESRRPASTNNGKNVPLPLGNPPQTPFTAPKSKHPFWQPRCSKINPHRHKRSLKQIKQVLNIMIRKLNQTFEHHIHKLYKEPLTKTSRYNWLPKNPGKKMKQISTEERYVVFYTRLQEYAVILHILNQTGPPAGYDPNQFSHAERQYIINSIADLIKQMLCELENTMKVKTKTKQVNLQDYEDVIPVNLNQTQLYVYDMSTFNAYKKFLISWKRLLQKGKKNGKKNNGDDSKRKTRPRKTQLKNPNDQKKKHQKDSKLVNGVKRKIKKSPGKQQKKMQQN